MNLLTIISCSFFFALVCLFVLWPTRVFPLRTKQILHIFYILNSIKMLPSNILIIPFCLWWINILVLHKGLAGGIQRFSSVWWLVLMGHFHNIIWSNNNIILIFVDRAAQTHKAIKMRSFRVKERHSLGQQWSGYKPSQKLSGLPEQTCSGFLQE